jgi:hypothetical protein
MTQDEQIRDDALAEGMDCEFMRINHEIDTLIETRSKSSSYGRGQIFILRELKDRITWQGCKKG